MAQQSYHKGGYKNHGEKAGGSKLKHPKKTTADLAKEVIATHFGGLEHDLLNLTDVNKIKDIFAKLEKFTDDISSGLTTSQLRNVYSKILEAKTPVDLQLLRPNLAYVAARNKNGKAKKVMAFVDYLIRQVDDPAKQKSLNKILEAIVAYHKYCNT